MVNNNQNKCYLNSVMKCVWNIVKWWNNVLNKVSKERENSLWELLWDSECCFFILIVCFYLNIKYSLYLILDVNHVNISSK